MLPEGNVANHLRSRERERHSHFPPHYNHKPFGNCCYQRAMWPTTWVTVMMWCTTCSSIVKTLSHLSRMISALTNTSGIGPPFHAKCYLPRDLPTSLTPSITHLNWYHSAATRAGDYNLLRFNTCQHFSATSAVKVFKSASAIHFFFSV